MGVLGARKRSGGRAAAGAALVPVILSFAACVFAVGFSALCFSSRPARAADDGGLKLYAKTIKAGLVYNFLKYTEWPADTPVRRDKRLTVCLFGSNPLGGNLAPLNGRTAQQAVIRIVTIGSIDKTGDCSLVFVREDKRDALRGLLDRLKGRPVLTVSDIEGFAAAGGMIELATESQRITLYVNKRAVDDAGLSIKGRLLGLAKMVSD
ncbi:MAG: DUF4154 domain-containing protein [Alphaproteobacteria bacterium]|nr:DUF4154 domain-containing protein [Alphaproteobacteria bacterium]